MPPQSNQQLHHNQDIMLSPMITPAIGTSDCDDDGAAQRHRRTAYFWNHRKTITKTSIPPPPPPYPATILLFLTVVFLGFLPFASAETTFRNCTYNGRFNRTQSLVSIDDIAKLDGSVSWGVSLDTSATSIDDYVGAIGNDRTPAIINLYFDTAHLGGDNNPLNCQIAAAKASGAILMLTLEPWDGLNTVNSSVTTELGQLCSDINDAGVHVLIRFAHEMNGDWYPWGMRPGEYRDTFRAVASAVKAAAPNAAMVWAPNTGVGYPFDGAGKYFPNDTSSSRFTEMDTNNDGQLNSKDDPFSPYYPGDDMVDWIGISLYSKRDNGQADKYANIVSDRGSLKQYISNPGTKFNLYQQFAENKNKPFLIAETAAAYYPGFANGDGEVAIKRNWWSQFWSADTLNNFPMLKAAVWFEFVKVADTGEVRDYTITKSSNVLNAFLKDVGSTSGVNFLSDTKEQLTGGNGGCACTSPKDRKGAAVAVGVDRVLTVLCALLLSCFVFLAF